MEREKVAFRYCLRTAPSAWPLMADKTWEGKKMRTLMIGQDEALGKVKIKRPWEIENFRAEI